LSDGSIAYLSDQRDGRLVEAQLIDGVSRDQVEQAERDWRPFLLEAVKRLENAGMPLPEHSHWDWRKKHRATTGLMAYRMFGLECDGAMQGLMLTSMAAHQRRIADQKGKEQVYIDYVASAPWNSPALVSEPRYGLVGRVLISTAVQLSLKEGFRGRIGPHALPQAEKFYSQKCFMTDIAAGSFFLDQLSTKISDHNSDGPTNLQERQALEDLVKMPD
jgi:hypothetical protein